ncbi:hypothetical protein [Janthinobacterium lividum]|uniref:hypothetical protein n=1 Tax=Janthinobacterium lividum TaxID=29581 RepID=UPI00196B5FBE|nr:hypothetical protein [Janthinobacterium lividum]
MTPSPNSLVSLGHAAGLPRFTAVDVNEHNTQAHGFYRHLGFIGESRSERDPFGKPFPILHLKLPENG